MQDYNGVLNTICIFHCGYFGYRGTFQTVLDSYCCVNGLNIAVKDVYRILHFQVIINIAGVWGNFDAEYMGSQGNIIIICKKVNKIVYFKN